jgi:hypothetical protein
MIPLLVLLWFFAPPFWEARPAAQWTDAELNRMLGDSPWAQAVTPQPLMVAMFATAKPVEDAIAELERRRRSNPITGGRLAEPDIDYIDYVKRHRDEHFVLAVPYVTLAALGEAQEEKRMETQCTMRVGKRQYHLLGHFPPTPSDPVLRLIFPRVAKPEDKSVSFDLYVPGITHPNRMVEFRVKEMMYKGKLEM